MCRSLYRRKEQKNATSSQHSKSSNFLFLMICQNVIFFNLFILKSLKIKVNVKLFYTHNSKMCTSMKRKKRDDNKKLCNAHVFVYISLACSLNSNIICILQSCFFITRAELILEFRKKIDGYLYVMKFEKAITKI